MGSVAVRYSVIKTDLDNDRRNVKDLWNDALHAYKNVENYDIRTQFQSVDDMIKHGTDQNKAFQKWRHDGKDVDKLRSLFMENISYIEKGAEKLVAAATPAFPPASVIGTAMTFALTACKSVSGDYDIITAFFEDMNSFLQRVSIIESRLPKANAYQNCLMDVFSSFLQMCGFARKFISQGRLKKWVINSFMGQDAELAGSRKKMNTNLTRLQSATEFAILRNTEDSLINQQDILAKQEENRVMQLQLAQNQEEQQRLGARQTLMLETVLSGQENVQTSIDSIKQLIISIQQDRQDQQDDGKPTKGKQAQGKLGQGKGTKNRVKAILPTVASVESQLQPIERSTVEGTSQWIFDDPDWLAWGKASDYPDSPATLVLSGIGGIGKTHLAASIYKHLHQATMQDLQSTTCTTFFCFHNETEDPDIISSALISAIVQVSEQNTSLRIQLENELNREDSECPETAAEFWRKLIVPLFDKSSNYHLDMILDGLDELERDDTQDHLLKCMRTIQTEKLNIRIICTSRPEWLPSIRTVQKKEIVIDKAHTAADIRRLISDRMRSSDSAYRGLARLNMVVKQKIGRVLEEHADGLLYVEHMLRYLSGIAREGAIIKVLDHEMPATIDGLYHMVLRQCQRRIPAESFPVMKALLAWIACCLQPLKVDEVNALISLLSQDDELNVEEQVQDAFSQFLQIGSTVDTAINSLTSPIATAGIFSAVTPSLTVPGFDDGKLEVVFRDRSMKEFFRNAAPGETSLRTPSNSAQSDVFLLCSRVINDRQRLKSEDDHSKSDVLLEYAFSWCLFHWYAIEPGENKDSTNVQICEAFTSLMLDGRFADGLESMGPQFVYANIVGDNDVIFRETWTEWSRWVDEAPMKKYVDAATLEYWAASADDMLIPLAKTHVTNWLNAADVTSARRSYRFARSAIKGTTLESLLDLDFQYEEDADESEDGSGAEENRGEEEIIALSRSFGHNIGSNAYYAIGVALTERGNHEAAVKQLELAIETCNGNIEQLHRNYQQLAMTYIQLSQWDNAIKYCDLCLDRDEELSPLLRSRALRTKGDALSKSEKYREAANLLAESRKCNPGVLKGDPLWSELLCYFLEDNWSGLIDCLLAFKSIEQLSILTWTYLWTESEQPILLSISLVAGARSGKQDELIKVYEDVIKTLDAERSGAPLRLSLAYLYWRLKQDTSTAKFLLNQILDSSIEDPVYQLTWADPTDVAMRAINMMSDILYQEFRKSDKVEIKAELLLQVRGLIHRNLPQLISISSSHMAPYQLLLAKMLRKLCAAVEYEEIMKRAFDSCIANLSDSVSSNDNINSYHLAMITRQMPSLKTQSEILNSAQWYKLDATVGGADENQKEANSNDATSQPSPEGQPNNLINPANAPIVVPLTQQVDDSESYTFLKESDLVESQNGEADNEIIDGTEGKIQYDESHVDESYIQECKGICFTREQWDRLDKERPMYQCLICTESVLCQVCFHIRLEWNQKGKPEGEPDFCCADGNYLQGPIANWRGIKDGKIHLDPDPNQPAGSEPQVIDFKEFLDKLKMDWKQAWDEFWIGG